MNAAPDPHEESGPSGAAAAPAAVGARPDLVVWGLALLAAGLGVAAYTPFLWFRANTAVSISVEGWFFEPSDRTPGVIVLLAFWLVWRRRRRLARLDLAPGAWPLTLVLLGLGVGGFIWAVRSGAPDLLGLSLFFNALGVAHGLAGLPALRVLALPAFVLLMAIPIPAPLSNQVLWTLQIWTADYTGLLLYGLGMPALVSGDRIIRADSVFAIIETCSGLRTMETLLLLAALMADLFGRRGLHTALLLGVAIPLAFTINGFRALLLIVVPGSEIDVIHSAQGIAMLLAGVLILYGFDSAFERLLRRRQRFVPRSGRSVRAVVPRLVAVALLSGVLVVLGAVLPPWSLETRKPLLPIDAVPRTLRDWEGADLQTDWLFYGQVGYRQALHRRYHHGREWVDVFVATGARERRYRSLLSPKTALPGSGWIVEEEGREPGDKGKRWRVLRKGGDRRLVHHWYEGLAGVPAESLRTLLALDTSPLRRGDEPVVVRLSTALGQGPEARATAEARLATLERRLRNPVVRLTRGDDEAS